MHNALAISNINDRSDPRLDSHSRRGLHRRLPRSLPLVSPSGLHCRAGCPEPPQTPVLPRSLPLVSPSGLHCRAGCPEPPQASVLPRSSRDRLALRAAIPCRLPRAFPDSGAPTPDSFHNFTFSSVLRRGGSENGHQMDTEILDSRSTFRVTEPARWLLAHALEVDSLRFAIALIA